MPSSDSGNCTNTATNGGDTRSYVYKVDLQGGTATKIAAGADPFVTPDGTLLCIDTNDGDLGEYSADGTTFHTIVSIAFYNDTTVVLFPLGGGDPVDMHTLDDPFTTFNAFREYQMSWR